MNGKNRKTGKGFGVMMQHADGTWSRMAYFDVEGDRATDWLTPGCYKIWKADGTFGPVVDVYHKDSYVVAADGMIGLIEVDPWAIGPGDFIKSAAGGLLGIVVHLGCIELAHQVRIPGYAVTTAAGKRDFIFAVDARIVSYDYDGDQGVARMASKAAEMQALAAESRASAG